MTTQEHISNIRAALSAPATAPAWHDAPTVPVLLATSDGLSFNVTFKENVPFTPTKGVRWYGPIPEDK